MKKTLASTLKTTSVVHSSPLSTITSLPPLFGFHTGFQEPKRPLSPNEMILLQKYETLSLLRDGWALQSALDLSKSTQFIHTSQGRKRNRSIPADMEPQHKIKITKMSKIRPLQLHSPSSPASASTSSLLATSTLKNSSDQLHKLNPVGLNPSQ